MRYKRWHARHPKLHGALPVGVHCVFEASCDEGLACLSARQTHGLCHLDQCVDIPDIFTGYEVGMKQPVVDPLTVRLGGRPGPKFLRQTAVEGVCPLTVRQALLRHEPTHARL